MPSIKYLFTVICCLLCHPAFSALAADDPAWPYQYVTTYINPIMPGDHPDPSLLKVGDDFYASGSSFHFTPYGLLLHSTDLVHWRVLTRVIPANWSGLLSAAPAAGTWGGTLSYFYGSYWYYFSNTVGGGQYVCKASKPEGPWSTPVKVKTTADTGPIGYDNSIFVDDDGTPYLLIKPGQFVNRIQRIGSDGHLTGSVINLDWVNADKQYSWAEGPVMCKRNGWYYYFVAGNVAGGQYVLRTRTLTADPSAWEALGAFFETVTDTKTPFRTPNHITQPFMLADSTWWTISHSYESLNGDDWGGKGRQGLLHEVIWDANGKPWGKAPTTQSLPVPALPRGDAPRRLPRSDAFEGTVLSSDWHAHHPAILAMSSLQSGWLVLNPGNNSGHLLQRDAGRYYSLVTKVALAARSNGQEAGLCLTNGNQTVTVKLIVGYDNGSTLTFTNGALTQHAPNNLGDTVWLRLERKEHQLTAFYGQDGLNWTALGTPLSAIDLDKGQPSYNSWVGNSQGLYAKGTNARFDCYVYRDGFSEWPLSGRDNHYGVDELLRGTVKVLTNNTALGGWFLMGGLQVGYPDCKAGRVEMTAASLTGGSLELWLNDLERGGTKLGEVTVPATGSVNVYKTVNAAIVPTSGQYDLYARFKGPKNAFFMKSIRFLPDLTTALPGIALTGVIIHPNPTADVFHLHVDKQGRHPYSLFDLQGRSIEEGFVETTAVVGANLPSGSYLLQLTLDGQRHAWTLTKR